jgi:DNA-binding CsgD family transcriptional regulator
LHGGADRCSTSPTASTYARSCTSGGACSGDAESDARDSLATGIEKSWLFARGVKPLLQSLAGQGRTDEAEHIIEQEFDDGQLPNIPPMIGLVFARAEVMAAMGKHAAAIEAFDDAVRRGARWGGTSPSQIGDILIAARSHHALGDHEAARARITEADLLARRWGTPAALGQVLHAQAMVDADTDQLSALREAAAVLERSPARLELASALVDLGAACVATATAATSASRFREGYQLARICGAEPVATTARHELAASGIRVQREQLTGAGSLTPSERRIAHMAANGGSNADIAQSLFVTVKTVEMHLTNIYRKLEISGRAEIPLALEEPATGDTGPD